MKYNGSPCDYLWLDRYPCNRLSAFHFLMKQCPIGGQSYCCLRKNANEAVGSPWVRRGDARVNAKGKRIFAWEAKLEYCIFIYRVGRRDSWGSKMVLLNLYSLSHFFIWAFSGRFIPLPWALFFTLSIGWELLELVLPFTFAIETWDNKIADLFVNCIGFYLGLRLKDSIEKSGKAGSKAN